MRVNTNDLNDLDINTIFVSQDHADRYGATCYVLNGLDWDDYENPSFSAKRDYFHFLGDAAWRLKNVKGAIHAIKRTRSERIKILGGHRFNIKRGVRWTFTRRASFYGVVGGKEKDQLLMHSKGLVFPVRWDEPCANAVLESLYFGCPVFATPYGCMPEIVTDEFGFLSNRCDDLAEAMEQVDKYSNRRCHEYAVECFNSRRVALSYLEKYEKVLAGGTLNSKPPRLKKLLDRKFLPWYE
jgi:glycosyltransferase involved in cell wall biosynthesis